LIFILILFFIIPLKPGRDTKRKKKGKRGKGSKRDQREGSDGTEKGITDTKVPFLSFAEMLIGLCGGQHNST
jgi:hypothetical protein